MSLHIQEKDYCKIEVEDRPLIIYLYPKVDKNEYNWIRSVVLQTQLENKLFNEILDTTNLLLSFYDDEPSLLSFQKGKLVTANGARILKSPTYRS